MGLFNRKHSSGIILSQYNSNLEKSFKNSRAVNVSYLDGISFGENKNKNSKKLNELDANNVLKQKQLLNAMSNNILVQSIIRTRTNQVLKFCKPSRLSDDNIGYHILPKNKEAKSDDARCKQLEDFIYYTGNKSQYREWRDTFPEFVTKLLNDLYVHDQINIERIYETPQSDNLNHFNMVDASSIVISTQPASIDKPREFTQYVDGKKQHTFKEKDLTFITYWGKSEITYRGYGQSPLQIALKHLDYHNDTTEYNGRFFKQGGTTKGLLFLQTNDDSQMSDTQLDEIRRSWQPLNGLNGAWKIPMVSGIKDAKFINMQQSSSDYEFDGWLSYLINMISSVFQIEPSELNFPNKSGGSMSRGGGSTLNEGNTAKTKVNISKEKGLKPILDFIERIINDYILSHVDPDYYFSFTLGSEDELNKATLLNTQLKNGLTINEARKSMGYEPLSGELSSLVNEIPGDASALMQYLALQSKFDSESNKQQQAAKELDRPNKAEAPVNNSVNN